MLHVKINLVYANIILKKLNTCIAEKCLFYWMHLLVTRIYCGICLSVETMATDIARKGQLLPLNNLWMHYFLESSDKADQILQVSWELQDNGLSHHLIYFDSNWVMVWIKKRLECFLKICGLIVSNIILNSIDCVLFSDHWVVTSDWLQGGWSWVIQKNVVIFNNKIELTKYTKKKVWNWHPQLLNNLNM